MMSRPLPLSGRAAPSRSAGWCHVSFGLPCDSGGQKGGSVMWIWSPFWSLDLFDQLIRRLMRRGQTAPVVRVNVLMARGLRDEQVRLGLEMKLDSQNEFEFHVRG